MRDPMPRRSSLAPLLAGVSVVTLLALGGPEAAFAQCAMCRDAVAASSTETRTAMNYAIIGLAMTPYGVAAFAAWTLSPTARTWVREQVKRLTFRLTGNHR